MVYLRQLGADQQPRLIDPLRLTPDIMLGRFSITQNFLFFSPSGVFHFWAWLEIVVMVFTRNGGLEQVEMGQNGLPR